MAARRLKQSATARVIASGHYEWTIASNVVDIDPVIAELVAICRTAGFSNRHCRLNVPVAVTEALSNAVLNGNEQDLKRSVQVRAQIEAAVLTVDVTDEGQGFNVEKRFYCPQDPDWLEREDGRGLFLMRALMDDVQFHCDPSGGHTVRLILRRT